MKPPSHRQQTPQKRCRTCRFSELAVHGSLLCGHGDNRVDLIWHPSINDWWQASVVRDDDVCDEWEERT